MLICIYIRNLHHMRVSKKGSIKTMRILFAIIVLSQFIPAIAINAQVITVGHGGSYDYATITEALAVASAGNVVQVADSDYTTATGEVFPLEMKSGVVLVRASEDILPRIDASTSNSRVINCVDLPLMAVIEGFYITGGVANGASPLGDGGGILIDNSNVNLVYCTITGNSAQENGGGVKYYDYSSPLITNCIFTNNSAGTFGGGIFCDEYSAPSLTNCLITGNSAGTGGGGVMCYLYECRADIFNCTITENTAPNGGGLWCDYDSAANVTNTILWGNGSEEIYSFFCFPIVSYSDVAGGYTGTENINLDPLFVVSDPLFHITDSSPCKDTGTEITGLVTDYDLEVRPNPDTTLYDIGADEFYASAPTPTPTPQCVNDGDVNQDSAITAEDAQLAFMIALGSYSPSPEEECSADCNGDDDVTAGDAQAIFLTALGSGTCADPLN